MPFLKNAAGALRRNLSDTAHHVLAGPHRGWKIAFYVAMVIVPGGSLAAFGFAWLDHRRKRAAPSGARTARPDARAPHAARVSANAPTRGARAGQEPSSWRLADSRCTHAAS